MHHRRQHQAPPPFGVGSYNQARNLAVVSGGGGYRKTSAEIVSEARTLLAGGGGGVRLVSTRRPITPREPRRQLYGKLAPPGRPPSAFSLQYLQFESRQLPSLEPIQQQQQQQLPTPSSEDAVPIVPRSGSVGTLLDFVSASNNSGNNGRPQGKLPALLSPPKITASLDNLSDKISPLSDLLRQESADGEYTDLKQINLHDNPKEESKLLRSKQHPLRKRQTKSFDLPSKSLEPFDAVVVPEESNTEPEEGSKEVSNHFLSKTRLSRSNDLLSQSTTETLLDLLKAHAGIKECNEETVQHINAILVELYTRLKGAKGSWRGVILGALYGLVECTSPKILLAVARVVLALCVTGSNLTGACKLVFKVARNEINDYLFSDTDVPELLIDGLGRASPLEEPEACIYGYGAVRFLASASQNSNNSVPSSANGRSLNVQATNKQKSIALRLARHGAVQLMVLHLQMLNEFGAAQKLCGPPLHALYQLAAALRALAGIPQVISANNNSRPFTANRSGGGEFPIIKETKESQEIRLELACPHLVKATEISIGEVEIQSNIVRTLSVLSEHDICCEALAEYSARIGMLLGPCNAETSGVPEKPLSLLSRLGYILGNIMAKFDDSRIQFYNNDVAMQYLLETLQIYSKQKLSIHNHMGDTVIDVLIKLVRVVANMSVNADVGFGLGTRASLGDTLLHLVGTANHTQGRQLTIELEELLQATLGALHNLSFYQGCADSEEDGGGPKEPGSVRERISSLSVTLCETLNMGPESGRAEAARVLGNMTRNPLARDSFCSAGGLKAIVQCLGSNDYELVATSSGVLVNLLGDWERRAPFRELGGPLVLRDILKKSASQEDWLLAEIVCQALWNFLIDSGNVINTLGEEEADYISENLAEFLDEDRIFKGEPPDALWEQFAGVAADLLERIQTSLSNTNSPGNTDDEDDAINIREIQDEEETWLDE